ncbi:MAG: T9SS type A sorting domain-containing protein [Chitinophagaceae bacterium]
MNQFYTGRSIFLSHISRSKGICSIIIIAAFLLSAGYAGAQAVTGIMTDFNGYWKSDTLSINSIKPDNNHNLLAFTYNGTTYSTGVNDALLTAKSESFIANDFWSLPVGTISGAITSNTKVGLSEKYDGVTNGASSPAPSNNLASYLTDGIKGLNIGTCIANLPAGSMTFLVSNINPGSIGDGFPDILVTQVADPGGSFDRYSFTNSSGIQVGNYKDIAFTAITPVGNWTADFYDASTNPMTLPAGFAKTDRPLRLWAADLSDFGITLANYQSIANFKIGLSGNSDVAFVAYSTRSFSAVNVLPVEISDFVAKKIDNKAQLTWQTHSEDNTGWFIIEKSIGNGVFVAIDSVKAVGLTSEFHSYSYTDKFLVEGNNHYRLKSMEIGGTFDYSTVVSVRGDKQNSLLTIYPNPALQSADAVVKHEIAKGIETLMVYNTSGVLLLQKKITKGSWQTILNLQPFSKGIFYLVWQNGSSKKTEKLFID